MYTSEKNEAIGKLYPEGIHGAISAFMREQGDFDITTAVLEDPEHGLTEEILNRTDVLIWWGHKAHAAVEDDVVERIQMRVLNGMGIIVLHSGHFSKIFKRLMGTGCGLRWREVGERERLWVVNPYHPITQGMKPFIEIPNTEMYGEVFDVPDPDELVFVSWFAGGDVFRSGAVWRRGRGKVFYFRPGHETYPIFHNRDVLDIIARGSRYLVFQGNTAVLPSGECIQEKEPLEEISEKDFEQIEIQHPGESFGKQSP